MIVCPVVDGVFGGIVTAVGAAFHNIVSNWAGGGEVDMSRSGSVGSRKTTDTVPG